MKCHYIPQFYLKRWTIDGNLVEFQRRRPGSLQVSPKRRSPAATGWSKDLYTFNGLPEDKRHHLETVFFKMVDSKAADALALMENRSEAWTAEIRRAWALFLMSLITRHPQDIEAFKFVYNRDFQQSSADDRERYEKARGPDDPPTVEEYFRQFHPDFIGNMAMNNLPRLVMHERGVTGLMNLHWSVCSPPEHGYFLTSDRPTVRTFLGRPDSHWVLPIGPRHLFVAAERKDYGHAIHAAVYKQGWKQLNKIVLGQAVTTAYANHERHLPLVQRYLGTATRPSGMMSFVASPETAPPLTEVP